MPRAVLARTFIGLAMIATVAAAPERAAAQQPVTLKAVTAWSRNLPFNDK